MKFKVQKSAFLGALHHTQSVVEKRNTMPILANILLEVKKNTLYLSATDLEIGIQVRCRIEGVEEGSITLGAKYLYDVVRELPQEEIILTKKENNWISLECGKAIFNIVGLPSEDFPALPALKNNNFHVVASEKIKDMIEKTIFSVSTDETRYQLNGVCFEKVDSSHIRMVATDGHRLSMIDKDLSLSEESGLSKNIIIPRKGLTELRKVLESAQSGTGTFELGFDGNNIIVHQDEITLYIRLIEGEYPDYKQVIPKKSDKKILVNREHLMQALKRISLLSEERAKGVKFSFSNNQLVISSNNPKLGEAREEIEIGYKGEEFDIGFNARYFLDVLNVLKEGEVTLELNDDASPGILKPREDSSYKCIVMPMKL
ncbi:MAG: DNA polymerase III subunit beta [Deltaproteobacteria bacterium]|nr:DNA polymerase III subunit beta [Deltaproteobacteria bacterium]